MDAEAIWSVLRDKEPSRAPVVEDLVRDAIGKLKLVRDTFPTYTLHDEVHAANVLRLMGHLLGRRAADLSGLEAATLILAAHYHDIGMVYTRDELAGVRDEPAFARYLDTHPEDYLAVRAAGGEPPLDVLERYCRSRHAERVYDHLGGLSDRLVWGNVPLYKALGEVCRSHNLDVAALKSDDFDPDFLAQCDLRLCALLLRLADILDLDTSRAPRVIYDHLGLAERRTARATVSDREWRKHLRADGFTFPADPRPPNYPLPFIAGPDHPAVEHDIRAFLDVVDDELRRCRPVLDMCARRWRDLALPGELDRRNIIGRGYTYGEFRFELDRTAVLQLFMGERLYEDPYVFVRELIQNAIDAVRLRQALAHAPDGGAVAVTAWEDGEGFLWVRLDDDGVGMDEHTLREYFLRVGRSYYNSAELRADLARRGQAAEGFRAISRFGIGVLSCFIAGDLVELSSSRVLPDGSAGQPLRLSLARDEEFFVLRQPPDKPTPMPRMSPDGKEGGYRGKPGTSVAVRIDPIKVDVTVEELARRTDKYVRWPSVPVTFNGRPAGNPPVDDLGQPRLTAPVVAAIPASTRLSSPPTLPYNEVPYLGPLEVGALPLDLTAVAPTPRLRGQLVVVGFRVPLGPDGKPVSDLLAGWPEDELTTVPHDLRDLCATAVRSHLVVVRDNVGREPILTVEREIDHDVVERLRRNLKPFRDSGSLLGRLARSFREDSYDAQLLSDVGLAPLHDAVLAGLGIPPRAGIRWAHNGVSFVPPANDPWRSAFYITGGVALGDHLRPDLAVSRDAVRSIPFEVHSAAQHALSRAVGRHTGGPAAWLAEAAAGVMLLEVAPGGEPTLGMALADPLVAGGAWDGENVIDLEDRRVSAEEARRLAGAGQAVELRGSAPQLGAWRGATAFLRSVILQTRLDLAWSPYGGEPTYIPELTYDVESRLLSVRSSRLPDLPAGLRRFPPMFFVPYQAPEALLVRGSGDYFTRPPVNLSNPLARWLVDSADALATDVPVLFARLRRALDESRFGDLNALLQRVAAARPDLAPPPEAYLRDDNPEGEWWTR